MSSLFAMKRASWNGVLLVALWAIALSYGKVPYFRSSPQDTIIDEGGKVTWKCDADGSPSPTITWRHYNNPIVVQGRLYDSNYYSLTSAKTVNTGWYTCVATNSEAVAYSEFWLGVGRVTKVNLAPSNLIGILDGTTVVFACETSSYPVDRVEWFLNDKLLDVSSSSRHSLLFGSWLQINNVSSKDVGYYYCSFTSTELVKSLKSNAASLKVASVRVISSISNDLSLAAGGTLKLSCNAWLKLKSVVYSWFRNGNQIASQNAYTKARVVLSDSGVYCCKVDSLSTTELRCLAVYVYAVPVVSTNEPSLYEVEEGRDVTLQCSTTVAKPYVQWNWSFNGQQVINSQRNFGPFTTITLTNVTSNDGGQYVCAGSQDISQRKISRKLTLSVIAKCLSNTVLNSDASRGTQNWTLTKGASTGPGARTDKDDDGNTVFVIETAPKFSSGSFQQRVSFQNDVVHIVARARMRCSNGTSSDGCPYLRLQLPAFGLTFKAPSVRSVPVVSRGWTWVTVSLNVTSSRLLLRQVSVSLLTEPLTGNVGNKAYFDDICVTFVTVGLPDQPPTASTSVSSLASVNTQPVQSQSASRGSPTTDVRGSHSSQTLTYTGSVKHAGTAETDVLSSVLAMHTGTSGINSVSDVPSGTAGESGQSGEGLNDSSLSATIWIVIGCCSAFVIIIVTVLIIVVVVRKRKRSQTTNIQVRYASKYNPYEKRVKGDNLVPNALYGGNQGNATDTRLVANVLYGEDMESKSNINSERPHSTTVSSDEYTYIVSAGPGQSKDDSIGYKNPSFGQNTQTCANSGSVYYETAVPEDEYVMEERKKEVRDDEAAQAVTTVSLDYACLDGTHARVDITHDSTQGNYY